MTQQTNLEAMHAMAHRERDRANELQQRVRELEAAQRDDYKAMLTWVLEHCRVVQWKDLPEDAERPAHVLCTIADIREQMEATL